MKYSSTDQVAGPWPLCLEDFLRANDVIGAQLVRDIIVQRLLLREHLLSALANRGIGLYKLPILPLLHVVGVSPHCSDGVRAFCVHLHGLWS